MEENSKVGLGALLTPENCALILIDHQPFQLAGLRSHDSVINNVVALAKIAKLFEVPTLLTTVRTERNGYLIKKLQDVFPEQEPIDRTYINAWQDNRVTDWAKAKGRKKLVIAALWTEICLVFPALHAAGEGYEPYAVTDASGGTSLETHEVAILRMVQAGIIPITWLVFADELQRDWARAKTVVGLNQVFYDHAGNLGTNLAWEQQLLTSATPRKVSEKSSA